MAGQISGLSSAYVAGGLVLLWSGLKNATIADTLKGFLSGNVPKGNPTGSIQIGITDNSTANSSGTPATTDSAIANDALKYKGHAYLFGGAPGPNGTNPWDCSSFANWVLGHDLNFVLPGSLSPGYNGASHGPTTLSYLAWTGATTISNSASAAQAGDLCVWQTHMGIAIGGGQMISAENPQNGTRIDTIAGFIPGEILFVRRPKVNPVSVSNPIGEA
jgi:cell wall-associated NlpC family hydrolase